MSCPAIEQSVNNHSGIHYPNRIVQFYVILQIEAL